MRYEDPDPRRCQSQRDTSFCYPYVLAPKNEFYTVLFLLWIFSKNKQYRRINL